MNWQARAASSSDIVIESIILYNYIMAWETQAIKKSWAPVIVSIMQLYDGVRNTSY